MYTYFNHIVVFTLISCNQEGEMVTGRVSLVRVWPLSILVQADKYLSISVTRASLCQQLDSNILQMSGHGEILDSFTTT